MTKTFLSFFAAAALLLAGAFDSEGSMAATAQKRVSRAPVKKSPVQPQTIYAQGYQKGYGDGFAQGQADWSRGVPQDFKRSDSYQRRDQTRSPQFASSEEYGQGYDLGFELAYLDAYYGRARNNAVPGNAAVLAKAAALADARRAREQQQANEPSRDRRDDSRDRRDDSRDNRPRGDRGRADRDRISANVPGDLDMKLRLNSKIDTKTARSGDNFTAVVVDPSDYEGATVVGHISKLNRSGRVTGKTELAIEFDTITLADGRQAPFNADLQRIYESEHVKKVDEEGNVETSSRTKDSQVRGGVGAAAGAILGGIAGGGKGAVLGAIIGGAAGVGTVAIEGNKDLILDNGTEMLVKTSRARNR